MVAWKVVAAAVIITLSPGAAADDKTRFSSSGHTVARMDPIINPGGVGGHVHNIFGASNFRNVLNTPEEMQNANCTSINAMPDKSNYWIPQMYFINPNGTYSMLRHHTLLYYKWGKGDSKATVQPFPPGLRMLTGVANKRVPGDVRIQGLNHNFWHFGPDPTNKWYYPNGTHLSRAPGNCTIVNAIHFPRCGLADGSLDSDDHFSHMAWPVNGRGEWDVTGNTCPDTHPVMYPQIFMEVFWKITQYMVDNWNKTGPNVILSNGDTTGITFHADFVNGWDQKVLKNAIEQCAEVPGPNINQCRAFDGLWHENKACRAEGTIPAEDVGILGPIDKLPGCNPRWDWDGPDEHPGCGNSKPKDPGFVAPRFGKIDYAYHSYPFAIPGFPADPVVDTSNGFDRLTNWTTIPNSDHHQGPVMTGTQAEIDAAKDGGETRSKVNGMKDASEYTNRVNKSPPPASAHVGAATIHSTQKFYCRPKVPWEGFPCPAPGLNTTSDATANGAQSKGPSNTPVSSAPPKSPSPTPSSAGPTTTPAGPATTPAAPPPVLVQDVDQSIKDTKSCKRSKSRRRWRI